jgi:MFS family permease
VTEEGERRDAAVQVPLPHAETPDRPPRLLTNRPFLWLVVGDSFAQLARWGFFLAVIGDATYRLDATPAQVGFLLGAFSVPLILVSPLYGAAADRWSPKWLLSLTSLGSMAIPMIALTTDSLAWLYVATIAYGLQYAAEAPARGALVPRLVPEERLVQANGMISAALALQLVVGPALGSLLVHVGGRRGPYWVTLAAAALAFVFYLVVPDRRRAAPGSAGAVFADVRTGFREAWRTGAIRRLFFISVAIWFLIGFLIALEPTYIKAELHRGQDFLGLVWATYGAGEVIGSLALARVRRGAGREESFIAFGLLTAAVGFLVYVSVTAAAPVIAGNVVFGIGFPFYTASAYALIQRVAEHPGKVTGAFSMTAESGPLVASGLLALLGADVAVRSWLFGSGLAFSVVALIALRVVRRERMSVDR